MPDVNRHAARIKLFNSQSIGGGSSSAVTSEIWNIHPGQAFSLWTEALTSSATVTVAINMYPGNDGTGQVVTDTLASNAAVGVLSGSDIEINSVIAKSLSVTLTNTGSSAAVITQSLLMY